MDDSVRALLREQDDIIARRQALALGMTSEDIRRLLRRREWATVHPGVYAAHTGPLPWHQRAWAAVLHAGPGAALCHVSALRAADGPGRADRPEGVIHVAVDRERRVVAPVGVQVHRMVALEGRVLWNVGPPRLRYEEAALDVALDQATDFAALGVLSAACQSRRTTAARLIGSVEQRGRVTRRQWLVAVLTDVAEGTCSVLEHGYLTRVERPHGLPRARRQKRGASSTGIVYRDADYGPLIVELDGRLFHDSTAQRDRDFERDLDAAVLGRDTRRLSYGQVYDRPCSTAGKIGLLLAARGWTGRLKRCGPDCTLILVPDLAAR
ncbi:MAG: type IV toxin-antitoxin system AbiEi family antitoxin domain-containing protein [Nocardioides sp.]